MDLQRKLISLAETELSMWNKLTQNGNRFEGIPREFEKLRISNAEELHKIIKNQGWPGYSLAGKKGSEAAFRIARSSIDKPELMKLFLTAIKNSIFKGEASEVQGVILEDCILNYQKKPQSCGVFFDWDEHGEITVNVNDVALANKKRKMLGMATIEEDMAKHKNEVAKELGTKPQDIRNRQQQEVDWAKRVGWLPA
jgi:hypothetical protein